MSRVAVVTGSNKGIGFAIVRRLCKQFDGIVYLTARNVELGQKAVEELNKEGLKPSFHQLDIDNLDSIQEFAKYIKETHGGLDVLINNAGIAFKVADTTPFHIQAESTIKVNYFGTLNVCNFLYPLLRPHARVVNMSSKSGLLKIIKSEDIRKKLTNENLTIDDISNILKQFIEASKEDKHRELGFPNAAYGMAALGLIAATFVQQRVIDSDKTREDILINVACPGYVATDMSSYKGQLTPDQGAETPVYLALIAPNASEPKGKFVHEKKVADWAEE